MFLYDGETSSRHPLLNLKAIELIPPLVEPTKCFQVQLLLMATASKVICRELISCVRSTEAKLAWQQFSHNTEPKEKQCAYVKSTNSKEITKRIKRASRNCSGIYVYLSACDSRLAALHSTIHLLGWT